MQAMHAAAASGDLNSIAVLASSDQDLVDAVNVEVYRRTPLFVAAMNGHASAVELLHRLGSRALDQPIRNGWTPMHAAAMKGHSAVIETLHRLGSAALDQPDIDGVTPMHLAAAFGQSQVFATFLRLGSATLDRDGVGVLTYAFQRNRTTVAELLLAAGVDPAPLAGRYPQQVSALLATPDERLLALRRGLYFSSTLLDTLLHQLDRQRIPCPAKNTDNEQ